MQHQQDDAWSPMSYNAALPSPGCHILIVGPSHLASPLASALLRVQMDTPDTNATTLPHALAALDRLYNRNGGSYNSDDPFHRQRQIHMAESWSDWMSSTTTSRMDHVILVVSPQDVPSGQRLLIESAKRLHEDYLIYPRSSIVSMLMPSNLPAESMLEDPWKKRRRLDEDESSVLLPGVPVFFCWGPSSSLLSSSSLPSSSNGAASRNDDEEYDYRDGNQSETTRSSLLMVARMILQRAWVGTRQGNSQVPPTCPLIACEHALSYHHAS
jgi:hypothetical protein